MIRARWVAVWLVGALMATSTAAANPLDLRGAVARQRAIIEELETRAAEESLSEFMRQAWPIIEPKGVLAWNWHLDAINEHLEAVTWGHLQYLIINAPPRNTKSSGVSVFWPAWEWIHKPEMRTISITGVSRLATRDAVNTRTIIQSEWYQRRWGHKFKLVGDQNVKTYYVNNVRGSRKALSLDADIVGEGGDRLSVDDPIDLRQTDNASELQRVNKTWDTSLFSRVNDPKRSAKLITMQRVHDNDLCGHVREMHDWTWLVLPTEFEAKHRCRTFFFKDDVRYERHEETGRRQRVVVRTRKVEWTDPRTKEGELLNRPRFDEKEVASLKKQGAATFAAQQQQRPISRQGTIIKRADVRYYAHDLSKPVAKITDIILSIDPALKAKQKNDFWVMHAWGVKAQLAHYFLLNGERGRFEYTDALRRAEDLAKWLTRMYPKARVVTLIENTAAGPEAIADLRDKVPGVIPQNVDQDKERRLRLVSPAFESHNVWVPGTALADDSDYDAARTPLWVQDLVEELVAFPLSHDHDDQVDTTSQAIRRFMTGAAGVPDGGHSSGSTGSSTTRF
jgi:predicted phage terminase large subunit-like protein